MLDLRGEHVDPADDEHVIRAAHHAAHAHMGAAAGAGLVGEGAQVMGAITDEGHAVLGERGEGEVTLFAIGQALAVRSDDFGQEVILPDVHAVFGHAFHGDARAHHLAEAVDVERINAHLLLDAAAHVLGPGLGAEDAAL